MDVEEIFMKSFIKLAITILLLLNFSFLVNGIDNKKKDDTFKKEYYDYLKNIQENGDSFTDNEIIDLNNNKFLGFDENSTLMDIETVFGKNVDKDEYSEELIWNVRLVYNANFNLLLKKDKIVAYEIKLPSNYLFKSKYKINGYETFKELIFKLGKPESIEALDENWNAMNWYKDNRKIVFIGEKDSKYPTYMQYFLNNPVIDSQDNTNSLPDDDSDK
jgi:hypothetical protein